MIVSFMAEKKSGKDFLCDFLVKLYGAKRLSFSDEVRHLTQMIHPWMPFDVDPAIKDEVFEHPNNPNGLTYREIWLNVGKVRNVDPCYFVNRFLERNPINSMKQSSKLYIITDFRTEQEYELLDYHEIPILKIERANRDGLIPDPFEDFVRRFKDYHGLFINNMNGTDEFSLFFADFMEKHFGHQ